MTDYFGTGSKKGRGTAQRSIALIEAMARIAEATKPISGRGVGYKLFARHLIASMEKPEMRRVYRLLKEAREQGIIPWDWIVDENRAIERISTWADPEEYVACAARSYRRDFWDQQPYRVVLVSEKGTGRGVVAPVLDRLGVGFLPVHGFSSATVAHDLAEDDDGRPLVALYVGDFDPSGMFMSQVDLPGRVAGYGGDHVRLKRIALTREHVEHEGFELLPSFPASDKRDDPRYNWFVTNHGHQCWELDAMDPNVLRDCVERAIVALIEPVAWQRCEVVNKAEQESLRSFLANWCVP